MSHGAGLVNQGKPATAPASVHLFTRNADLKSSSLLQNRKYF